jgi:signal transduction histidine kinase
VPDPLPAAARPTATPADVLAEPAAEPPAAASVSPVRRALRGIDAGFRDEGPRGDVYNAIGTFAIGVALLGVGVVAMWSAPPPVEPASRWWHLAPLAVGCLALMVRRRHTALALVVGLVALGADIVIGGSLSVLLVLWELVYAVGLHGSRRLRRVVGTGVAVLVATAAVLTGEYTRNLQGFVLGGMQAAAILATPLWWAANVRQKSELADLAAERADLEAQRAADLERIAELGQHEAVRAERAAMARDLHDVIASHLSAIAIHSGAALASPPDPAKDRAALELVRASSITSLEEMRAMILLLRSDLGRDDAAAGIGAGPVPSPASAPPGPGGQGAGGARPGSPLEAQEAREAQQDREAEDARDTREVQEARGSAMGADPARLPAPRPTVLAGEAVAAPARLAGLGDVLASARAQGLTVTVADPDGARSATLPAAVDQAAHRIVQEALTNAAKHAPGGRVLVALGTGPGVLTVEVTSSLTDAPRPLPPSLSARTGLLTMRERAEALGGAFEAGPDAAGGSWTVRATLPLGLPAPVEPPTGAPVAPLAGSCAEPPAASPSDSPADVPGGPA